MYYNMYFTLLPVRDIIISTREIKKKILNSFFKIHRIRR